MDYDLLRDIKEAALEVCKAMHSGEGTVDFSWREDKPGIDLAYLPDRLKRGPMPLKEAASELTALDFQVRAMNR